MLQKSDGSDSAVQPFEQMRLNKAHEVEERLRRLIGQKRTLDDRIQIEAASQSNGKSST